MKLSAVVGVVDTCDAVTRCCTFKLGEPKRKTRSYVDEVCFNERHQLTRLITTDEDGCRG